MSRRIAFGLLLAALGLCGSVLAVGLALSAPSRAVIGSPPGSLAGAEAVSIESASGAVLQGWWLAGQPGAGVVMLMHGVHSNRLQMVRRAAVLHGQGMGVLLFDLRVHGESTGSRITFGKGEALDAAAAVHFVRSRAPRERVGAIGVSLGGAAALLGPAPLDVDALVLESVYPAIEAALANRLRAALGPVVGTVAAPVLTPLFTLLLPPVLGVAPGELRPIERIGNVSMPVLVASGTADDRTPLEEARALYLAVPESLRAGFWAVPGAGHVDLEAYDPQGYWAIVLPYLQRNLCQES